MKNTINEEQLKTIVEKVVRQEIEKYETGNNDIVDIPKDINLGIVSLG